MCPLDMTFELHDAPALIRSLCALPREQNWLEFKENTFHAETVGKYVSGLANAAMLERQKFAFMVWGIRDKTHELVGTAIRLENERVGSESFFLWLNKLLRPRINVKHEQFEIDGNHIEMLVIDPGYNQPVSFQGHEFIRIATSLTPLRDHVEKTRALWAITSSYSFENATVSPHMTRENIFQHFDIKAMLKLLDSEDRTLENMIDKLESLSLISSNLQGGYEVTALLAMCAAKNMEEFPLLENRAPRVIAYKGGDKLDAEDDTEGQRGYLVGFKGLLSHIMSRIPSEEKIITGVRRKIFKIPEESIREFVANAIIHQDFTVTGSRPLVEIYKDRVRLINPGDPLIDVDRFIDGGTRSRNPNFARLMRLAGLCEERGSGVDRAVKEIEKAALPPPLFVTMEGSTAVTAYMPRRFADMTPDERIRACLQHAQVCLESNNPMSNASLRSRFGLTDKQISQVSNVIRDAQDAGKIKPLNEDQANRNARYVPAYA